MILRSTAFVLIAIALGAFATPVRSETSFAFKGTVDGSSTTFGLGTAIDFTGTLTDPTTETGEGVVTSEIEIAALSIGGVVQTGVLAWAVQYSIPSRFDIFVRFESATNPDLFVSLFLPEGWESDFPELSFDLEDAGVSVNVSEINEDGYLPDLVAITSFTAVPEPSVALLHGVALLSIAALALGRRNGAIPRS